MLQKNAVEPATLELLKKVCSLNALINFATMAYFPKYYPFSFNIRRLLKNLKKSPFAGTFSRF
jgi:hypothetical protein